MWGSFVRRDPSRPVRPPVHIDAPTHSRIRWGPSVREAPRPLNQGVVLRVTRFDEPRPGAHLNRRPTRRPDATRLNLEAPAM